MLKKLLLLLVILLIGSTAYANNNAWFIDSPTTVSQITTHPYISRSVRDFGGQWGDVYYPDCNTQDIKGMLVHFHGGGWTCKNPAATCGPRVFHSGEGAKVLKALVERYVLDNWIFVDVAYPLSMGVGDYTLSDLYDGQPHNPPYSWNLSFGSIKDTFNAVLQWRSLQSYYAGKTLDLVIAGQSAGAWVAQRLAHDFRNDVTETVLIGPPLPQNEIQPGFCETEYPTATVACADLRYIYEYDASYGPCDNPNDLCNSSHANFSQNYPYTNFLVNTCDGVAESGDAQPWFTQVQAVGKGTLIEKTNPNSDHEHSLSLIKGAWTEVDGNMLCRNDSDCPWPMECTAYPDAIHIKICSQSCSPSIPGDCNTQDPTYKFTCEQATKVPTYYCRFDAEISNTHQTCSNATQRTVRIENDW